MTTVLEATAPTNQVRGAYTEAKDPFTRLLDLTQGWAQYVEEDETEHADHVKAQQIYDLYQSVAPFAEPYWDATPEVQEMAVRQFIETRLLPLLTGGGDSGARE